MNLNPEAMAKLARVTHESFLYLTGEADAAKTHIALCQGLRLAEAGHRVAFIEESDYFVQLSAEFSGGSTAPDLLAPDVLIYDDLGKKKPSAFATEKLYHLLSGRWSRCRSLIVTSNFTPSEVVNRLTDDPAVSGALYTRLTAGQVAGVRRGVGGRKGSAI